MRNSWLLSHQLYLNLRHILDTLQANNVSRLRHTWMIIASLEIKLALAVVNRPLRHSHLRWIMMFVRVGDGEGRKEGSEAGEGARE